jgi:hypothetical protein
MDMRQWMTGLAGAAAGAVLTASVFLIVGRGPADTASGSGAATGERGVSAVRSASASPRSSSGDDEPGGNAPGARDRATMEAALDAMTRAELQRRTLALSAENRSLQEKVQALEARLAGQSPNRKETYDLGPEELANMAQNCELRWDMPSLSHQPPTISDNELARLSLSGAEREIINQKFAASHARLVQEVRRTYLALTGDEDPGSMSADAMFAEIADKISESEIRMIFKRLSHERAGLMRPPADLSSVSPVEQLYRVMTSEGDALEQALGQELGPELASNLRDLNSGWSSKFRSTHGCPQ